MSANAARRRKKEEELQCGLAPGGERPFHLTQGERERERESSLLTQTALSPLSPPPFPSLDARSRATPSRSPSAAMRSLLLELEHRTRSVEKEREESKRGSEEEEEAIGGGEPVSERSNRWIGKKARVFFKGGGLSSRPFFALSSASCGQREERVTTTTGAREALFALPGAGKETEGKEWIFFFSSGEV